MIGRIRERRRFDALRRHGRRTHTDHLWCRALSDPTVTPPRVAFAIGRAAGTAVARNRLRRRLRALLAESARTGRLMPGWLLIGATVNASELTYDQLRRELDRLTDAIGSTVSS